jgi:hypothetical protein
MRKLGCLQQEMLRSLKEHGSWYRGCGWLWDTPSHTEKILESLMKRQLVKRIERFGYYEYFLED